ncbi:glycerophosphodiester phosphodiesterase family protein [Poseidonocella sp. HB161398]|uniref:glycerophosphodiester phosphodiesterase n=1 Tax=Poseidonocella sp. HB161398 TaxID=2320855 RepID=UPI001108235A|nr:glycerophosphodiester phosphodiesterase family protein [Poseidonocella sp. HB161398]
MPDPATTLRHAKGETRLKWHRGRRMAADMEFDPDRILEGMAAGASVEIDLVAHAGGGFAVLHDFSLDRSTTGTGRVAERTAEELRQLRRRGNDGAETGVRVALLGDLCAAMAAQPHVPGALLQLDLKEEAGALGPADAAAFAAAVAPVADRVILSGGDKHAVARLADALPGMRTGYDPCHFGAAGALAETGDDAGFVERALQDAGKAEMIYLDIALILGALGRGFDPVAAFHAAGRMVDAYTITGATPEAAALAQRLAALGTDQITTDDPAGLAALLA